MTTSGFPRRPVTGVAAMPGLAGIAGLGRVGKFQTALDIARGPTWYRDLVAGKGAFGIAHREMMGSLTKFTDGAFRIAGPGAGMTALVGGLQAASPITAALSGVRTASLMSSVLTAQHFPAGLAAQGLLESIAQQTTAFDFARGISGLYSDLGLKVFQASRTSVEGVSPSDQPRHVETDRRVHQFTTAEWLGLALALPAAIRDLLPDDDHARAMSYVLAAFIIAMVWCVLEALDEG